MSFNFQFPAVSGQQGGRTFYLTNMPFSCLPRLLQIDVGDPLDRSQREVDTKRSMAIAAYVASNQTGFVLPCLTGIVDDQTLNFKASEISSMAGVLELSMDATIKLFDGQHRATAICDLVKRYYREFGHHMISVQLFVGMTLEERQQAFSDINSKAKAVSTSLNLAYDKRDKGVQGLASIVGLVDCWDGAIDYERNIVSSKTDYLFTLKHVIEANRILLGLSKKDEPTQEQTANAAAFWNAISDSVHWSESGRALHNRDTVITHNAIGLLSLSKFGNLCIKYGHEFDFVATQLQNIDMQRSSKHWIGLCVDESGNMIANSQAQKKTAIKLMELCAFEINPLDRF